MIVKPYFRQNWVFLVRQCIPLRVTVVPLKPRNFRKTGRPEIPEISVLGSVFRESDCYDKYRKYRNCSAIPKFLELPEITRKLQKETEIPIKNPEITKRNGNSGNFLQNFFKYTTSIIYTTLLISTDIAYITYIIYVLWPEFPGFWPEFLFLFVISGLFPVILE